MKRAIKKKIKNYSVGMSLFSGFLILTFLLYEFYQSTRPRYVKPDYNRIPNYYKGDMKKVPNYYKGDVSKLDNYYKGDVTKSPNYYIPKSERMKKKKNPVEKAVTAIKEYW